MNNFATCYLEKFEVMALSNIKDKAVMDGWMDGRSDGPPYTMHFY